MNPRRFQRQRVFDFVRSNAVKIKSEEETFPRLKGPLKKGTAGQVGACIPSQLPRLSQTGESASSFLTHAPCRLPPRHFLDLADGPWGQFKPETAVGQKFLRLFQGL